MDNTFCSQCGTQTQAGAPFCSGCGKSVNAIDTPQGTTPPKKKNIRKWIFIGAGILLFLIIIGNLDFGSDKPHYSYDYGDYHTTGTEQSTTHTAGNPTTSTQGSQPLSTQPSSTQITDMTDHSASTGGGEGQSISVIMNNNSGKPISFCLLYAIETGSGSQIYKHGWWEVPINGNRTINLVGVVTKTLGGIGYYVTAKDETWDASGSKIDGQQGQSAGVYFITNNAFNDPANQTYQNQYSANFALAKSNNNTFNIKVNPINYR